MYLLLYIIFILKIYKFYVTDEVELLPLVDSTSSHKRNRSNTGLSVQSTVTNDSTQASSVFEPINTVHSLNKKKFNFSKKNKRKHFKKFEVNKEKPSLLRSSAMKLVQIYIPTEIIHYTLQKLGELSLIHVVDVGVLIKKVHCLFLL